MSFKVLKHTLLAGLFFGVAAAALPQPVPPVPLPGLEVRIATQKPPALRHERRGESPGPDHVWIGGFWHWEGSRWHWVPGRWEARIAPSAYWIPARYIHGSHGYIYEPGHWSSQTIIVTDEIRHHSEWRHHERDHERELERERERDRERD
jgi:YXWGXW repeat-containing protein